jgi:ABC-type multidrug transport system fused ATPase/permease subunit
MPDEAIVISDAPKTIYVVGSPFYGHTSEKKDGTPVAIKTSDKVFNDYEYSDSERDNMVNHSLIKRLNYFISILSLSGFASDSDIDSLNNTLSSVCHGGLKDNDREFLSSFEARLSFNQWMWFFAELFSQTLCAILLVASIIALLYLSAHALPAIVFASFIVLSCAFIASVNWSFSIGDTFLSHRALFNEIKSVNDQFEVNRQPTLGLGDF